MKKLYCLLIILIFALIYFAAPAAAVDAEFTGPDTAIAGDTVTLTYKLNNCTNIESFSADMSYDTAYLTFTGAAQTAGASWLIETNANKIVLYDNDLTNPINGSYNIFTLQFRINAGVPAYTVVSVNLSNIKVSEYAVQTSTDQKLPNTSYSVAAGPPLSTSAKLSSLSIANANLSPDFNGSVYNYTVTVPYSISKLDISATAADASATVAINSPELTPNTTTVASVTVTMPDGSRMVYYITAFRERDPSYVPSGNNSLSAINLDVGILSPKFSPERTSYVVWLPYETESINITGIPADPTASAHTEGGALTAGEDNIINVICVAENGAAKVYNVTVKRAAPDAANAPSGAPGSPAAQRTVGTGSGSSSDFFSEWGIPLLIVCIVIALILGVIAGYMYKNKIKDGAGKKDIEKPDAEKPEEKEEAKGGEARNEEVKDEEV